MLKPLKERRTELPIVHLLPNALTLGAICAGLTAIRMAAFGAFDMAVALVLLACVLDGIDGRLARALGSQSPLGAELDSLADFLNFGVAPAIILYFRMLGPVEEIGWIAVLTYALCCVMRLARFNVGIKSDQAGDKRFFTGVPSPAGAFLALAPVFLDRAWPAVAPYISPEGVALWLILVGLLMVSRIPTFSLKSTIYADNANLVLISVAAGIAALAVYPWQTLIAFDVVYLCTLLLSWRASKRPVPFEEE